MSLSEFYEKTGGFALMVIKYKGDRLFSYVNRPNLDQKMFSQEWDPLVQFMEVGKFYVIGGRVRPSQRGVAYIAAQYIIEEVSGEAKASQTSQQFRHDVESGNWNPAEAELFCKQAFADWQTAWWAARDKKITKKMPRLIQF